MTLWHELGPVARVALVVFLAAAACVTYWRVRAARHPAPGIPALSIWLTWRDADYARYAPEGQRWLERAGRAGVIALLAFFASIVLWALGI